jgi:diketogulonate reductase-like aldo/keto reductase
VDSSVLDGGVSWPPSPDVARLPRAGQDRDVRTSVQGVDVPAFLYGTAWKEGRTEELVRLALASGFVGIDTANQRRHYVEAAVGDAAGGADVFLQTKFTFANGQDHRIPYDPRADFPTQVQQSFASSLEHLRRDAIDAYLLHGPSTSRGLTAADWEVWRAMEDLQQSGRVRLIGVSNVSLEQLAALWRGAAVKPAIVQNRCYARTGWDREVRAFCRDRGLLYEGFSLLTANLRELSAPAVRRIVARTGRTLPEVVFRFCLDLGLIVLTGTTSGEHMRQDLGCFDIQLDPGEIRLLEDLPA